MYHLSHERLYSNLKDVHFLSFLSYDNPYLVKFLKFSYQAEHAKTLKDQMIIASFTKCISAYHLTLLTTVVHTHSDL